MNSSKDSYPDLKYYSFYGETALEEALKLHNELEQRLKLLQLVYELDLVVSTEGFGVVMIIK